MAVLAAASVGAAHAAPSGPGPWQVRQWTQAQGAPASITAIAQDRRGFLWIGSVNGVYRFDGVTFEAMPTPTGRPQADAINTLAVDKDDVLWIGHDWGGVSRLQGGRHQVVDDPAIGSTVTNLLFAPDGALWALVGSGSNTTASRLANGRWSIVWRGPAFSSPPDDARFDRQGRLLFLANGSLHRVSRDGRDEILSADPDDNARLASDPGGRLWLWTARGTRAVDERLGLAGPTIPLGGSGASALAFDHDGGLWRLSTQGGLERFSAGVLASKRPVDALASFPAAPAPGGVSGHKAAAFVDREGSVWFATDAGLVQYRRVAFDTPPQLAGPAPNAIVRLDAAGWRAADLGVDAGYMPQTLLADPAGGVLGYVGRGNLWNIQAKGARTIWPQAHVQIGFVDWIAPGPGYTLMGGPRGLARYDGKTISVITRDRLPFLSNLAGGVQTPAGDTWLQGPDGVMRLRTKDLERAFADPSFRPPMRVFDISDGVPGPPSYFNRSTLAADRWGRIWTVTDRGVARLDPAALPFNGQPPSAVITGLKVDGASRPLEEMVVLPRGARRLEIAYTAPSFVNPGRVRFRYRLDGVDQDWIDAGDKRAAQYTNLAPGRYRFQLQAANNDGVWSPVSTPLALKLPPTFLQSWIFKALVLLAIGGAAWAAYTLRTQALAQRLQAQMETRLRERERIARELHDTLLQGVQGMILRFQSIALRMPAGDQARGELEAALDRADNLVAEGRLRVRGLRQADGPGDLPEMISRLVAAMEIPERLQVQVVVQGAPAPFDAVALREIGSIVGEALFNASEDGRSQACS